jgi:hypothetical protein
VSPKGGTVATKGVIKTPGALAVHRHRSEKKGLSLAFLQIDHSLSKQITYRGIPRNRNNPYNLRHNLEPPDCAREILSKFLLHCPTRSANAERTPLALRGTGDPFCSMQNPVPGEEIISGEPRNSSYAALRNDRARQPAEKSVGCGHVDWHCGHWSQRAVGRDYLSRTRDRSKGGADHQHQLPEEGTGRNWFAAAVGEGNRERAGGLGRCSKQARAQRASAICNRRHNPASIRRVRGTQSATWPRAHRRSPSPLPRRVPRAAPSRASTPRGSCRAP